MDNSGQYPEDESCWLHFFVFGEMPLEMWQRYQDAQMRIKARYAAVIPKWLADNPPICARIWPDGRVTTHGPLGSWNGTGDVIDLEGNGWTYTPEPYFLYSATGELIRQTHEKQSEDELFAGNLRAGDVLDELCFDSWMSKAFIRIGARGWRGFYLEREYYIAQDHEHNVAEVYELDGTCYGPDFDIRARDANKFEQMYGDYLVDLFKYQQELGIIAASAP